MTISVDQLRNGLPVEADLMLPSKPSDPEMRESASLWMYDETGKFGFPRCGVEAVAESWDNRPFQANFAFADGRILNGAGKGAAPSPIGPDGRPTVLGAGALTFRVIEPFKRWSMTFDGPAVDGHVSQQIAKTLDPNRRTNVRLEVEMQMVTPAWVQKTAEDDKTPEAAFMGLGWRYEHLCRVEGAFHIDGKTHPFKGTGLHIHRQSVRRLEGFIGHCWQSAVFPDGRAFGCLAYPPTTPGGPPSYNDAYIYQDGRMIPAKMTKIPWLRRVIGRGDDVTLELESELGRTTIEGITELNTFNIGHAQMFGLNLQQGGAFYRWGGQTAYGMIERSSKADLCTIG